MMITAEMVKSARSYVPIAEKETWLHENSPKCFDLLNIEAGGEKMPPMYMINSTLKSRYLMAALARLYFGVSDIETDKDNEWLMTEAEYDRWAGAHVLNQIERFKSDAELRNKCFDILTDYRDLEKRFSAQIHGLLTVQNDPVIRQSEQMSAQMKELPELLKQLKELQENHDEPSDA